MRDFVFKDGDEELRLPVTPPDFEISDGIKIETVNITNIGDVIFGGNSTIEGFNLSCFFPAHNYEFSARDREPYDYVNWFIWRVWNRRVIRFIVTNTPINIAVMIENISYGEKDGTGDVYYTLNVRRYKQMYVPSDAGTASGEQSGEGRSDAAEAAGATSSEGRSDDASQSAYIEEYIVKKGDCLWDIAVRKYGNSQLWSKIQSYNNKSSTLLQIGEKLMLPPKATLEAI